MYVATPPRPDKPLDPRPCARPGAIQQPPVTQPFQGLGPGQALDVRQELQDATAHVGLNGRAMSRDVGQRRGRPANPCAGNAIRRTSDASPGPRAAPVPPAPAGPPNQSQSTGVAPAPAGRPAARASAVLEVPVGKQEPAHSAACSTLLTACRIARHGLQPQSVA